MLSFTCGSFASFFGRTECVFTQKPNAFIADSNMVVRIVHVHVCRKFFSCHNKHIVYGGSPPPFNVHLFSIGLSAFVLAAAVDATSSYFRLRLRLLLLLHMRCTCYSLFEMCFPPHSLSLPFLLSSAPSGSFCVCLFFCDSILNKYLIGMALLCVIVGALTSDAHVFVYFIAMHLERQKKPNETGEHIKSVHVFNVFYLILFISLTVWCSKN